jgi:hypothetical protein
MHIYKHADLYNHYVQEQADEALEHACIVPTTHKKITATYTSALYTPNYFIRIALALLTIVSSLFGSALVGLMLAGSIGDSWAALLILVALVHYATLEWLVRKKQFYNAGVDNVLMFVSAALFIGAFVVNTYTEQWLLISVVGMVICLLMAIRFTDSFMAMLSYIAILASVFLLYIKLGTIAKATAPFLMMAVAATVFLVMKRLLKDKKLLFYRDSFRWVTILTLLSFYAACNYFLVKELSNSMFNLKLTLKDPIPLGWLFWTLTFAIPVAYFIYGIVKKDLVFARIGVVLSVVSILTFRYYYSVMPAEVAMLIAGFLLTIVAYWLTRFLKSPKHGFVFAKSATSKDMSALETLILIETTGKDTPEPNSRFGGGDFGGGGAGGNY